MKYRIYIDEVGNANVENATIKRDSAEVTLNARYLSLTGIVAPIDFVRTDMHPQLEDLKKDFFDNHHPDDPIIFHRKNLIHANRPYECLRDEKERSRFYPRLFELLGKWKYRVFSVCIDKTRAQGGTYPEWYRATYPAWRYDPYHYCLAVLIEKSVLYLDRYKLQADVVAESRNTKPDTRLRSSFCSLIEHGTEYVKPSKFQSVLIDRELKIKDKKYNITGLQIADLIASPSRSEILLDNGLLGRDLTWYEEATCKVIAPKYDQWQGRIYGKKFLKI